MSLEAHIYLHVMVHYSVLNQCHVAYPYLVGKCDPRSFPIQNFKSHFE